MSSRMRVQSCLRHSTVPASSGSLVSVHDADDIGGDGLHGDVAPADVHLQIENEHERGRRPPWR